jgi:hypothetical protein
MINFRSIKAIPTSVSNLPTACKLFDPPVVRRVRGWREHGTLRRKKTVKVTQQFQLNAIFVDRESARAREILFEASTSRQRSPSTHQQPPRRLSPGQEKEIQLQINCIMQLSRSDLCAERAGNDHIGCQFQEAESTKQRNSINFMKKAKRDSKHSRDC